jgi:histidinol-phosphate aminotransferase
MSSPQPHPLILDIKPYVGGEAAIAGMRGVVKLSSNEGAFGAPPAAREAFRAAADSLHRYPDGGCAALRTAIGATFGLDPARIVCGAGSDDLIYKLALAYGGDGTELIMTRHGFSIYRIAGRFAGCRVIETEERDLTADVDAILAAVTPATRLMYLANPNNPTGSLLPAAEVRRLRAGLPGNVLLLLDAAYAEYVDDPDYEAGAALVDAADNTVMTRTFSKIYGLGGMRLGWAYAPPAIIDVLNRVREPFNVNIAVQAAALAALAEPGWVQRVARHNANERARLAARLTAIGLRVWPSAGNFLLVDFATTPRAEEADSFLRSRGLIVRAVGGYGLPHCLRITIGTTEECDLLATALTTFQQQPDTRVA